MPTTVVGCGGCICGVERRDRGARAAAAGCGLTATGKSSWWISPCSGGRVDVIDRAYAMSVDLAVCERQARLVRHKLPCRCPHRDCPAGAVTGAGPAAVRGSGGDSAHAGTSHRHVEGLSAARATNRRDRCGRDRRDPSACGLQAIAPGRVLSKSPNHYLDATKAQVSGLRIVSNQHYSNQHSSTDSRVCRSSGLPVEAVESRSKETESGLHRVVDSDQRRVWE